MADSSQDARRARFRAAAALGVLHGTLILGLLFHSSDQPVLFGRYSWRSLGLIAALLLAYPPAVWGAAHLLFRASELRWGERRLRLSVGAKLLALATALTLAAGLAELRLRTRPRPARSVRFDPFWQQELRAGDPLLPVNAAGFRGGPLAQPKPPGTFRIFVVGGSTVLSAELPYADSPPRVLEERLNARDAGATVEVFNAGCSWHTTQHSLAKYLFRIRDYQPDLVVVWHAINDLSRSFAPTPEFLAEPRRDYAHYLGPLRRVVAEDLDPPPVRLDLRILDVARPYTRLFFSDLRRSRPVAVRRVEVTAWPSLEPFRRNLQLLSRALRADGVALVLATQPSSYRPELEPSQRARLMFPGLCRVGDAEPSVASLERGMATFNQTTREVAQEEGVLLLDLARRIPRDAAFIHDDCHYTPAGGRRVGEELARFLVEEGLVPE